MKVRSLLLVGAFLAHLQPVGAALAHNARPHHEQQIQDTRKKDHWGANEWTALFSGGLFLVAFFALIFARNQIKIARKQTQVGVLFELEARWGNREILDGRAELSSLYNKVSKRIISKFPSDTEEERQKKIARGISIYIFIAKKHDLMAYRKISALIDFFETVGVFIYVLKGLEFHAVANLLAACIETMDRLIRRYIEQLKKKDRGVYFHTLQLFDDTREWLKTQRD